MQNLQFCNTGNALPVVALPPRAAVHTVLAKPTALQPLLAALQTTILFAIEDSIQFPRLLLKTILSNPTNQSTSASSSFFVFSDYLAFSLHASYLLSASLV
ncbi:MAG: hypothetical protein SOW15_01875 [Ruminococcus callidus]|nr:hypothetical protein [Ruminococcus callidus]